MRKKSLSSREVANTLKHDIIFNTTELKKKLKPLFNKWIRLRDSDRSGKCQCVTCGKTLHYKAVHAGHFEHGLDYIPDNQTSQCAHCNKWNSGERTKYTIYMIDKYGRERVDELIRMKKAGQKWTVSELEEMLKHYKAEVKRMEKEKDQQF